MPEFKIVRRLLYIVLLVVIGACYKHAASPSRYGGTLRNGPTDAAILANVAALTSTQATNGYQAWVQTLQAPWHYCASCSGLTVDHITIEATGDGGNTRWVRDNYQSPVWTTGVLYHYVDGTNGNDENQGIYTSPQVSPAPLKTWAEWIRRVGVVWHVYPNANQTVSAGATWPADPLPLEIMFHTPTTGAGQVVTFNAPALTTNSTGTFSAVTARNNATNTPFNVTDGTVVTTGDVQRRITITAGARSGAQAWVAKSTGSGQRRTSEWSVFNPSLGYITGTVVPQVGDAYSVQSATSQLIVDHIIVRPGPGLPFTVSPPTLIFNGVDFKPPQLNTVPMLQNGAGYIIFNNCQFIQGEWHVFTNLQEGDFTDGYTYFANCCFGGPVSGGIANVTISHGSFVDTLMDAGLVFGNINAIEGSSITIDYNTLCQGTFSQPFAGNGGGFLSVGQMGVMDWSGSTGGVIIGDGLVAVGTGRNSGLTGAIWGTTANAGAWGMDIRDGGTLRYKNGVAITITGPAGDFRMAGALTAQAWNGSAYTAAIATTWANLFGGTLLDNAHSLTNNAHAYKNSGAAQP